MTYLIPLSINMPGFLFYKDMIRIVPDNYSSNLVKVYLELSR